MLLKWKRQKKNIVPKRDEDLLKASGLRLKADFFPKYERLTYCNQKTLQFLFGIVLVETFSSTP